MIADWSIGRDVVLGVQPPATVLEDFWGLSPHSNAKLLNIFLKFSYFAQELETHLNFCSQ